MYIVITYTKIYYLYTYIYIYWWKLSNNHQTIKAWQNWGTGPCTMTGAQSLQSSHICFQVFAARPKYFFACSCQRNWKRICRHGNGKLYEKVRKLKIILNLSWNRFFGDRLAAVQPMNALTVAYHKCGMLRTRHRPAELQWFHGHPFNQKAPRSLVSTPYPVTVA